MSTASPTLFDRCDSPTDRRRVSDRILRDLRRRGVIGYRVVDRSRSLYEVTRA